MERQNIESPISKKWEVQGDKWDREELTSFAQGIAIPLIEVYSDLSVGERKRKMSEFTTAIKTMDDTGQEVVDLVMNVMNVMNNGLIVRFVEPRYLVSPVERDYPGQILVGALWHSQNAELVGPDGNPLIDFRISNSPRLDIIFEPNDEMTLEAKLGLIKHLQHFMVDLNVSKEFHMSMLPRYVYHTDPGFGSSREYVSRGVAEFRPSYGFSSSFYRGRGRIALVTSLHPLLENQ